MIHLSYEPPSSPLDEKERNRAFPGDTPFRGLRALVVEDNEDSLEWVAHVFAEAGATVIPAHNGIEGFEAFLRYRPDVIVADLCMTEGDGFELIQRIRSLPEADRKRTPAVAISAVHGVQRAMRFGYNGFIAKPVDEVDLIELVRKVLQANR